MNSGLVVDNPTPIPQTPAVRYYHLRDPKTKRPIVTYCRIHYTESMILQGAAVVHDLDVNTMTRKRGLEIAFARASKALDMNIFRRRTAYQEFLSTRARSKIQSNAIQLTAKGICNYNDRFVKCGKVEPVLTMEGMEEAAAM